VFVLAVLLAVVGAFLIAFGAELQEHAAVGVETARHRLLSFFLQLLSDGRWMVGALLVLAGVGVHVVALTNGPVVAIQPVGSIGLLFAVGIKAAIDRTRLEQRAVLGSAAVIAGLAGFLTLLPHDSASTRLPLLDTLLAGACALAVTATAWLLPVRNRFRDLRAGALAFGAGTCFGVGAAVIGVIGRRVQQDVTALWSWPTLLVVVLLVSGGAAQQVAYQMARFAVVYAVLLATDAGFAGVLLLGERMPTTPAATAGLAVAALVAVAGVVVLARARAANRTVSSEDVACVS
jgi:hypothetical protein